MTMVSDGLYQWGGAPVGSGLGYGWKGDSTVRFVDATNGSDDNVGESPDDAFATINQAISKSNKWDVIYIAPKDHTSNNLWIGTAYQDTTDLSIPYAKQGIAMVGIGHQALRGTGSGVVMREKSASTSAILQCNAPYCAFENLAFENQSTAVNGLYLYGDVLTTNEAQETAVYNCYFYNCVGSGATGNTGGAVKSYGTWGTVVEKCKFYQCRQGISFQSGTRTAGNLYAIGNYFGTYGTTGSGIGVDIYAYCQGASGILIANNYFAHLIPAYPGSECRYISTSDVRQGLIANNHIGSVQGTTLTIGSAGTGIMCNDNVGHSCNYCNGALMAEAT